MIKIENKANRIVMWSLIAIGLGRVFLFSFWFAQGFMEGLRGF